MANMDPVIIMDQDPLTHPSYATFSEAMVKEKKSTAEAEALWKLLIDGFRHQRELNKDAQKEAEAIKNTAQFNTLLIKYAIPEPLKSIYQDNFIYFSEKITNASTAKKQEKAKENYMSFLRGVIRSTNPEFEQFAHKLRALLTISENRELALWSGGIDLSTFSYDKGRCPLEQTVLGNLLNNMPITTLWNLEAPLWNIISRTFVSQYTWLPVHVTSAYLIMPVFYYGRSCHSCRKIMQHSLSTGILYLIIQRAWQRSVSTAKLLQSQGVV